MKVVTITCILILCMPVVRHEHPPPQGCILPQGLGQAKTNAKVEGEKAHDKTESTFNNLTAEAKSAISDAQQSTAGALHAAGECDFWLVQSFRAVFHSNLSLPRSRQD